MPDGHDIERLVTEGGEALRPLLQEAFAAGVRSERTRILGIVSEMDIKAPADQKVPQGTFEAEPDVRQTAPGDAVGADGLTNQQRAVKKRDEMIADAAAKGQVVDKGDGIISLRVAPAAAESACKHAEEITPEPAETAAFDPDPQPEEIAPAPPPAAAPSERGREGRPLVGRALEYWQWLQGVANAGEHLPWVKTETCRLAGIPTGSMGYVFDTLKGRGFIVSELQTEDGGWSLELRDGIVLRSAPREVEDANPEPENITEKITEPVTPTPDEETPAASEPPCTTEPAAITPSRPLYVQPAFEKGSTTCTTDGCAGPKQPGRDHCAVCLTANAPERKRANMRDSYI